ncbi:MAG TPA: ABC transporter substrate-binding protein [Stellaceae bacterium]|nr:ABC transporter substrate-binding protein [Stellaceae bacterium]
MSHSLFAASLAVIIASAGPAAALDKVRVGTPAADVFEFAILDAGIGGGFFKKQGLDVQKIDFAGGAKEHQAMAAGDLDFAVTTGADILFVIRGAPEKAIAAYGGAPVSLVISARPDSGIQSLADLKGRTVGATSMTSMTAWVVMELSRKSGWGPDGIRHVGVGGNAAMIAALEAHNVDAICGSTGTAYELEAQGKGKIVARANDKIKSFIADMLTASDDMIRTRPDEVRGFLRAWFETVAFMKRDKASALRLTQNATQLPPEIASKIYDDEMPSIRSDGHFDKTDFAAVKQSLIDLGLVTTMPPDSAMIREDFLP